MFRPTSRSSSSSTSTDRIKKESTNVSISPTIRSRYKMDESLQNADIEIFYSKQADYRTRKVEFEIGGKNKTREQLKNVYSIQQNDNESIQEYTIKNKQRKQTSNSIQIKQSKQLEIVNQLLTNQLSKILN